MSITKINTKIAKMPDKNITANTNGNSSGSNRYNDNDDVSTSDVAESTIDFNLLNANISITEWTAIKIESVCEVTDDLFPLQSDESIKDTTNNKRFPHHPALKRIVTLFKACDDAKNGIIFQSSKTHEVLSLSMLSQSMSNK